MSLRSAHRPQIFTPACTLRPGQMITFETESLAGQIDWFLEHASLSAPLPVGSTHGARVTLEVPKEITRPGLYDLRGRSRFDPKHSAVSTLRISPFAKRRHRPVHGTSASPLPHRVGAEHLLELREFLEVPRFICRA